MYLPCLFSQPFCFSQGDGRGTRLGRHSMREKQNACSPRANILPAFSFTQWHPIPTCVNAAAHSPALSSAPTATSALHHRIPTPHTNAAQPSRPTRMLQRRSFMPASVLLTVTIGYPYWLLLPYYYPCHPATAAAQPSFPPASCRAAAPHTFFKCRLLIWTIIGL
jgi:hypothetical protein